MTKLPFPGRYPAAAEWRASERRIRAVGLDTTSIDYGQSSLFESHQVLARHNITILENVIRLDRLPAMGAIVFALPMKFARGSGGPLRIVAWLPGKRAIVTKTNHPRERTHAKGVQGP